VNSRLPRYRLYASGETKDKTNVIVIYRLETDYCPPGRAVDPAPRGYPGIEFDTNAI
jgi:hypothetical protein